MHTCKAKYSRTNTEREEVITEREAVNQAQSLRCSRWVRMQTWKLYICLSCMLTFREMLLFQLHSLCFPVSRWSWYKLKNAGVKDSQHSSPWQWTFQEWYWWCSSTCWSLGPASGLLSSPRGNRRKVEPMRWRWRYWETGASTGWWGSSPWQVRTAQLKTTGWKLSVAAWRQKDRSIYKSITFIRKHHELLFNMNIKQPNQIWLTTVLVGWSTGPIDQ